MPRAYGASARVQAVHRDVMRLVSCQTTNKRALQASLRSCHSVSGVTSLNTRPSSVALAVALIHRSRRSAVQLVKN